MSVPGRVNLIGEHIDYHDLPVLPMGIQRSIQIAFRGNETPIIRIESEGYGSRSISIHADENSSGPAGDWSNYVLAATRLAASHWPLRQGIDAAVASDLPPAAGLSSSSALLIGLTLALLTANSITPDFDELMNIFPDGEQFVGTRGGGMDHAAILASRAGSALLVEFAPLAVRPVPIPSDWAFLAAHSLTTAEKSGAMRSQYNSRREAGSAALRKLGLASFRSALESRPAAELAALAGNPSLSDAESRSFLHVIAEAARVREAVTALENQDPVAFGGLLNASHASLRDHLQVSNPALDELVDCAMQAGALGARLTGAGFGGYTIILCAVADQQRICTELVKRFYARRSGFNPEAHLFVAEPSAGVVSG